MYCSSTFWNAKMYCSSTFWNIISPNPAKCKQNPQNAKGSHAAGIVQSAWAVLIGGDMCCRGMQVLVAGHFTHLPARIAGPRNFEQDSKSSAPAALLRCTCKVPSCSCGKHPQQHIYAAGIYKVRSCGKAHADCRTRRAVLLT